MCGVLAAVAATPDAVLDHDAMARGVAALAPRGPDGEGLAAPGGDRSVALGHRRLAIQDPGPAGAQPMSTPDGRFHLTYNGEVYDHPALRVELTALGARYRSDCDSETVLHAWAAWGEQALDRLDGIFAFALWDAHEQRLHAARDRLGVKPLCWARTRDGGVAVASTPGALVRAGLVRPALDPVGLREYLVHGVAPGTASVFAGVHQLAPGHVLRVDRGTSPRTRRWWTLPSVPTITDPREAATLVADEVARAVDAQLLSDVPVATLLSGGLDSSVVTAAAQRASGGTMHAITVGFEEDVSDERAYARVAAAATGVTHHESVLRRPDALRLLDELPGRFDEPYGLNAVLPMLFVAEQVRAAGFSVVLSGDGADELFGGYLHHDELAARYARWGLASADTVGRWWRYAAVRAVKGRFAPLDGYRPHDGEVTAAVRRGVLSDEFAAAVGVGDRGYLTDVLDRDREPVEAARLLDLGTYLPDQILTKVDRATMAHGVEARVPLLDHRLVELAFAIAPGLHRRGGQRKRVLKDAARQRGWLPEEVLSERKKGFSLRIDEWLLPGGGRGRLARELVDGALVDLGVLRRDGLGEALATASGGDVFQLWVAERWARRWL